MQFDQLNAIGYTPVGDIMVIAMSIIIALLVGMSSMKRSGGFSIMVTMIAFVSASASADIFYRACLTSDTLDPTLIYIFRIISHLMFGAVEFLYIMYLRGPLWIKNDRYKHIKWAALFLGFAPVVIDTAGIVFGFGFSATLASVKNDLGIYPIFFVLYEILVFYLVIRYRSRIVKQIFRLLIGINAFTVILIAMQGFFHQSSYTAFCYFLPTVGLLFMFHTSPFDIETGAASDQLFAEDLSSCIAKNIPFTIFSCTIKDIYDTMRRDKELKSAFFRYFKQNYRRGVLYRFPNGRMILLVKKQNGDALNLIEDPLLTSFYELHQRFQIDYKLVIMENSSELKTEAEYMRLITFIEEKTSFNETRRITAEDITALRSRDYIISELDDIRRKNDLADPRVLVYCQPVLNILTGKYDTAEALMRLKLPEKGLVFPDVFIPIAEQYDIIHTLSLIILNKTCMAVHELLSEGYFLKRISVNFSTIDIRCDNFTTEVRDIIDRNGIPYDCIAVEITESRSELEFNRMKQKVEELQELGIKFYLDDFGTGYSNFERIMEIPFDIIKFDRSMLIESVKKDSSHFMVSTFADMFNRLNYAVLFEGVEDERDEKYCVGMHASYLQGYKYSKPIPIERLREFFEKTA